MSFRLRHEWKDGARVNGAQLALCPHCEALRVELEPGRFRYVRRVELEAERVRDTEPPCLSPLRRPARRSETQQQLFAFIEGMRAATAPHIPATGEQLAAALASLTTCRKCGCEYGREDRCPDCAKPRD